MIPHHRLRERAPLGAYLAHTAAMLAFSLLFTWTVASGCLCDGSLYSDQDEVPAASVESNLKVDKSVVGTGERAARSITPAAAILGAPTVAKVSWWPPKGAADIQFTGLQPNPAPAPPPFVFDNVPVAPPWTTPPEPPIQVSYTGDDESAGTSGKEHWSVTSPSGETVYTTETTTVTFGQGPGASAVASGAPAVAAVRRSAAAGYSVWRTTVFLKNDERSMTTELCTELLDAARAGSFFGAARIPGDLLGTGEPDTFTIPLVKRDGESPHVDLVDYRRPPGQQTVLSIPLELSFERMGQLGEVLPVDEGSVWGALTPAPASDFTCPQGLDIPPENWEAVTRVALDFGGDPAACDGCRIDAYGCYEGYADPLGLLSGATAALARAAAASTYQGSGITCVGPVAVRLASEATSPLVLSGPGMARLEPPGRLVFHHWLENYSSAAARTVTFSLVSSQGLTWRLYRGDPSANQEITGQFTVGGFNAEALSAVADVPALGTALPGGGSVHEGSETLTITATTVGTPGQLTLNTDIAWLGSWTPPPIVPRLQNAAAQVGRGAPVVVSGELAAGNYRLVVVPNGSFAAGECYAGTVVAAVDVVVAGGTLPATTVWGVSAPGGYDVLALVSGCDAAAGATSAAAGTLIVAGDDLSAAAGVTVSTRFSHLRRRIPM